MKAKREGKGKNKQQQIAPQGAPESQSAEPAAASAPDSAPVTTAAQARPFAWLPRLGLALGRFFTRAWQVCGRGVKAAFGTVKLDYKAPAWIDRAGASLKALLASQNDGAQEPVPGKQGFIQRLRKVFRGAGILVRAFFNFKKPLGRSGVVRLCIASVAGLGLLAGAAILVIKALPAGPVPDTFTISSLGTGVYGTNNLITPLTISWSRSVARIDLIGKEVSGVAMEPELDGTWRWTSDRVLTFTPKKYWGCGTSYALRIDRSILAPDARPLTLEGKASTAQPALSLIKYEFYVNPADAEDRRLVAWLGMNYPLDSTSVKDKVKLKVASGPEKDKEITREISFDKEMRTLYVTSEKLPIPADSTTVKLVVAPGIASSWGGAAIVKELSAEARMPGLYDFVSYTEANANVVRNERFEYEQVITIGLSAAVDPGKLAKVVSAWLLPEDRKGIPGYEDEEDHFWSAEEVDAALLKQSRKLDLEMIPVELETAEAVAFKVQAPSGRFVFVQVQANAPLVANFMARNPLRRTLRVPKIPRSIAIMHPGTLLSLGGDRTISLVANDLQGVRFELKRIIPDVVNHFVTQNTGSFSNPEFYYSYSENDMSVAYREERKLATGYPGQAQFFSFNFSRYLEQNTDPRLKYGIFLLRARGLNYNDPQAERFVLVTDIGLLMKQAYGGRVDVFAQNLRTGQPVAGALVQVLGRNGLVVMEGYSDETGRTSFTSFAAYQNEKQPVVVVAKSGGDMSFLPVGKDDRFINYSRFDTGGVQGASDPGKLAAYLFSDRGIYRPGEKVSIAYMVKAGDWQKSIEGIPLSLVVQDPRGVEVYRRVAKLHASGFDDFAFETRDWSPTGVYTASVYRIYDNGGTEMLGSTSVRVEEFQPDRLTVKVRVPEAEGRAWIPFADFKARVEASNLYGMPADGNQARITYTLSPRMPSISRWPAYSFQDPHGSRQSYSDGAGPQALVKGVGELPVKISGFEAGSFTVRIQAEVLEKQGGRGVAAQTSLVVSPNEWLLGYKTDGQLDYVPVKASRAIDFIAINPAMDQVEVKDLKLKVLERRYVSVLTRRGDGTYAYESVLKRAVIAEKPYAVSAKGARLALDTSAPGDFELEVVDARNRTALRIFYSVAGRGTLTRGLERNAELELKLDKASYAPGETISINIKAPYTGSGLITIERDKVYAYRWFSTSEASSVQSIVLPEGIEGTAYLNVSFLRSIDSESIYMSPLSYGVVPFEASLKGKKLAIELDAPEIAKAGGPLTVGYRADRPCRMVVYAVDEGILQVARYRTPEPIPFFFRKRALEVGTSQILDLMLPEFSVAQQLAAMGGDEDGSAMGARLNPFKRKGRMPVVFWSGIVDADTSRRQVQFDVPDWYNGTVRLMAVAVSPDAAGQAERKAIVRNDFIITPTVPTFAVKGDEMIVGVSVANNARTKAAEPTIQVLLQPSRALTLAGSPTQQLKLAPGAEGTLWFKVKVTGDPGEASLRFSASAEGLSSSIEESLSVRPATSYRAVIVSGKADRGQAAKVETKRIMVPEKRSLSLTVGFKPQVLATGMLDYLAEYPYGCSEQMVSASFPLIAGAGGSGATPQKVAESWQNVLSVMQARLNDDGSMGIWSANGTSDAFVDAWSAHYLTVAKAKGFQGGQSLLNRLLERMRNNARVLVSDVERGELDMAAYSVYVLSLNGIVASTELEDVRSALENTYGDWKKSPAGLFVAGSYSLLKKQTEAEAIFGAWQNESPQSPRFWESTLTMEAMRVYMLARHSPRQLERANDSVERIVKAVEAGEFSTVSSAWVLLAFDAWTNAAEAVGPGNVEIVEIRKDGSRVPLAVMNSPILTLPYSPAAVALEIRNKGSSQLWYQLTHSGFDVEVPTKAETRGVEVFREFTGVDGKPLPTVIKRGDDVEVLITVRAKDPKGEVPDLAIVDLLPGGFEIPLESGMGSFASTLQGTLRPQAAEAREDRAIFIVRAGKNAATIRYRIRAVTAGTFVVPGIAAESMYDRAVWGEALAGSIVVAE